MAFFNLSHALRNHKISIHLKRNVLGSRFLPVIKYRHKTADKIMTSALEGCQRVIERAKVGINLRVRTRRKRALQKALRRSQAAKAIVKWTKTILEKCPNRMRMTMKISGDKWKRSESKNELENDKQEYIPAIFSVPKIKNSSKYLYIL